VLLFLGAIGAHSQTTIAVQDFDGATPAWGYSSDVTYFSHQGTNTNSNVYPAADGWTGDGFYGIIDLASTTNLDYASLTDNILGETDLDDEGTFGTGGDATTTLAAVNVSAYTGVTVSFDFDVEGYNANADEAFYELFYDGTGQGRVTLQTGSTAGDDAEGSVSVNVPNGTNTVALEVIINNNGNTGYSGFDNFKIEGASAGSPSITLTPGTT